MNDSMNVHRLSDLLYSHFSGPSPTCIERNVRGNEWGVLKTTCSTTEGWNWRAHKVLPPAFWNLTRLEVKSGDSIITKAGPRHRVGVASFVDFVPPQIVPSGKMICLRPNPQRVLPGYLALALSDSRTQRYLDQRTTGMAESQVNFENNALLGAPVWLPERDEQERILEALTGPTAAVTSLERLIAKKRSMKHGIMQQLLTGKTRLPGFIKEWASGPIGELYVRRSNLVDPRKLRATVFQHFSLPAFDDGQSPVLESGLHIDSMKFSVPANAILISKLNPRIPRIWAPARITDNAIASTEFLVAVPKGEVDRSFLTYLFQSPTIASQMKLLAVGTTGSHARIHPNQVATLLTRWPEMPEQVAIGRLLADSDAEIEAIERRLMRTRDVKLGMMQELLSGRNRLTPAELAA